MITHKKRNWSVHIQIFAERPTTRTLAVLHVPNSSTTRTDGKSRFLWIIWQLAWEKNSPSENKEFRFLFSTFESFLGFREFFPRLSVIFFKRARGTEVKPRDFGYEVWLVSYLFFSFQISVLHEQMVKVAFYE